MRTKKCEPVRPNGYSTGDEVNEPITTIQLVLISWLRVIVFMYGAMSLWKNNIVKNAAKVASDKKVSFVTCLYIQIRGMKNE